ncbi:MAG: type II secretion system F family protein [Candidatus Lindowbacteria bacterium]|nr:type II secretion system F family protein [Candidatus Lindowbacteria bacterium]
MLGAILAVVTMLILAGIGLGIYMIKGARRNIARERLMEIKNMNKKPAGGGSGRSFEEDELDKSFFERVIQPVLENTAKKFKKDPNAADPVAELIIKAGNPGNLTSAQFKALQLLLAISALGFFSLLGFVMPEPVYAVIFGAVGGGMAFIGPKFWLGMQVTKRRKAIKKMIPDTLDLLTVSVEAGLGFDQAIQKVCERLKGPLSEEFTRMLQEQKIGKSRKDALRTLADRAEIEELDAIISSIIQADTLGVSIGTILRIQSDQLRVKRRQQVEEMAQKLPIKMLFPMIFFIFPTIFIVTLGPIGIKVMTSM